MLKTVLETLDGVDDAVKPFYAEADGAYVLQVDGIDAHPDVANLKNAYERVKADKQTLSSERDALRDKIKGIPDDFDPKKWDAAKSGKADPAELVQLRQTLEAERDDWKGKYEGLTADMRSRAIRDAVSSALAAQGVPEGTRKGAALAMLDGRKVDLQGETPVIDTDMGPMSVSDYAKRWAAGDGKGYVAAPAGGGAKGKESASGGTQVSREQFDGMSHLQRADFVKSGGTVVSD